MAEKFPIIVAVAVKSPVLSSIQRPSPNNWVFLKMGTRDIGTADKY
jgi:hypothetical protein